eukprot:CAMPEP_0116133632 /NCGR_PEP_ID=MMETSP0329-20121206/10212_1 /TAXON_ID=697910 /ORGANISM="Pseudo-nitzschia arenysensis, Strain B593" /LENGTH=173 /DNA_ID=CAMNT_0003628281 /DNA_START=253 /DNA_END=774 /DNA_ORIENTATION=-
MSDEDKPCSGHCMTGGMCCAYDAIDCNNIEMGCRTEEDCLCIRHTACLSMTAKNKGFLLTTDENDPDEICKLGLFCCDVGLVKPSALCSGAAVLCCFYEVCSFPCSDQYVDECVCAYLGLQCAPKCGCCIAPPSCPALDKLRSDEVEAMIMEDRGSSPAEAQATVIEGEKPKE